MSAPIIEHYRKLAVSREGSRYELSVHPFALDDEPQAKLQAVRDIRSLMATEKHFFKHHSYRWAARLDSYRNGFEGLLQLFILVAISDISPEHPHYELLSNICARAAAMGGANAHSFQSGEFRYALVSTGLLKLLWEFLHTFDELAPRPARYEEKPGTNISASCWIDGDAEQIAENSPLALDRLIQLAAAYVDFRLPTPLGPRYSNRTQLQGARGLYIARMIAAADAFIVLHEVGHLLRHKSSNAPRTLTEEIEADEVALSLMIILASKIPSIGEMFLGGISLAFAAMRYANLVGKIVRIRRYKDAAIQDEEKFENELYQRSRLLSTNAIMMGLPAGIATTFDRQSQEFFLLTEATKIHLLKRLKRGRGLPS